MSKLNELLETIKKDSLVVRFNELEDALKSNEYYKTTLNTLKSLQRKMIINKSNGVEYASIEEEYNTLYAKFTENPTIDEYLEIKEELNKLVRDITDIFEREL